MKITVVYHSRWVNCERIARSIARALSEAGQDVTVLSVDSAGDLNAEADPLVVGSPTRAGSGVERQVVRCLRHGNAGPGWQGRAKKRRRHL